MSELKPCPFCGLPAQIHGDFNMEALSCSDRTGDCPGSWAALSCRTPPQRAEALAAWNRRAQPAAPADEVAAVLRYCRAVQQEGTVNERVVAQTVARMLAKPPDAAPSVAPEPVAWTTQLELNWIKNNTGRAGSFYEVKAGPNDIPLFAHPPRAPLTEGALMGIYMEFDRHADKAWTPPEYLLRFAAAVDAHGIRGQG